LRRFKEEVLCENLRVFNSAKTRFKVFVEKLKIEKFRNKNWGNSCRSLLSEIGMLHPGNFGQKIIFAFAKFIVMLNF
jgi:hypothetical protein